MIEDGGPEGKGAKPDRRIDHRIAGRNEPKHGESDDEPRRHADKQRPGNRLGDSLDEQLATAPASRSSEPLKQVGDAAVVVVRWIELADAERQRREAIEPIGSRSMPTALKRRIDARRVRLIPPGTGDQWRRDTCAGSPGSAPRRRRIRAAACRAP